ncbi:transposase [Paenibacillus vortex V453]|uniref:Transposase n=1 Tax=Paenibacillus vortex V453 TaxID=715225 RepID=A0A2R9SZ47_9BACL|nr:transposase [Paenibacillus vortex V453]
MATRVSYPVEVKEKAIEMRLDGIPVKEIMEQLNSLVVTDAQITLLRSLFSVI